MKATILPIRPKQPKMAIRWMVKRDIPALVDLDWVCFSQPWDNRDFRAAYNDRQAVVKVVEIGDELVGYVVWGTHQEAVYLIRLAVAPEYRRLLVASQLLATARQNIQRRGLAFCRVDESNLAAQLCLRKAGWIATENGVDEDGPWITFVVRGKWL